MFLRGVELLGVDDEITRIVGRAFLCHGFRSK
jgi:hypothetical protein